MKSFTEEHEAMGKRVRETIAQNQIAQIEQNRKEFQDLVERLERSDRRLSMTLAVLVLATVVGAISVWGALL